MPNQYPSKRPFSAAIPLWRRQSVCLTSWKEHSMLSIVPHICASSANAKLGWGSFLLFYARNLKVIGPRSRTHTNNTRSMRVAEEARSAGGQQRPPIPRMQGQTYERTGRSGVQKKGYMPILTLSRPAVALPGMPLCCLRLFWQQIQTVSSVQPFPTFCPLSQAHFSLL